LRNFAPLREISDNAAGLMYPGTAGAYIMINPPKSSLRSDPALDLLAAFAELSALA
jgi:hypothetical protein